MVFVTVANPFILGFGNVVSPSVARAFVEGGPGAVRQVLFRAALPLGLGTTPDHRRRHRGRRAGDRLDVWA